MPAPSGLIPGNNHALTELREILASGRGRRHLAEGHLEAAAEHLDTAEPGQARPALTEVILEPVRRACPFLASRVPRHEAPPPEMLISQRRVALSIDGCRMESF
jgi:hypothetical protein